MEESGGQCVMMDGTVMMLQKCVIYLDSHKVSSNYQHTNCSWYVDRFSSPSLWKFMPWPE